MRASAWIVAAALAGCATPQLDSTEQELAKAVADAKLAFPDTAPPPPLGDAPGYDPVVASAITGLPCLTASFAFASDPGGGGIVLERRYTDGRVVRGRLVEAALPSPEPMFVADIYDSDWSPARSIYVTNLDGDSLAVVPYESAAPAADYTDAMLALVAAASTFPHLHTFTDEQLAGLYVFAGNDQPAMGWTGGVLAMSMLLLQTGGTVAPPAPPPVIPRPIVPVRPMPLPLPLPVPRPLPIPPRPIPVTPPVVPVPQPGGICPAPSASAPQGQPQPAPPVTPPQPTPEQVNTVFIRERAAVQQQCGQAAAIQNARHIPWAATAGTSELARCQEMLRNPPSWATVQTNMANQTGTCSLADYLCLSRNWLFCAAAAARGGGLNGTSACRGLLVQHLLARQGVQCTTPIPAECTSVGGVTVGGELSGLLPAAP